MKLLLQVCAVVPLLLLGGWVDHISVFGSELNLSWFGVPLTLFWLLGCINAVNLLDGMDGLATIVGLATASMIGLIAMNEGHPHVTIAAVVLAGSLSGFLVYNLPPASIFLGDSGSLVIGLVVGLLGIEASMKTATTLAVTAPAVVMALPMLDVVLAVIRRRLTGRAIDSADRQHIHHRLLDRGLTNWQVLCILGAMCALTGAAATTASFFRSDILAWVITLSLVVLVIRLRLFGHHEFILLKQAFAGLLARWAGRLFAGPRGDPPTPEELQGCDWEEVWAMLIDEVRAWRVRRLEFTIATADSGKRQWTWYHTGAADQVAYAWTVAVSFRTPQAEECQLRASLADAAGPASLYLSGLARLLRAYGQHMAHHPPDKPLLSVLRLANDDGGPAPDIVVAAPPEKVHCGPHGKEEAA